MNTLLNEPGSPDLFLSFLTDPKQWAAARWRASAFLGGLGSSPRPEPPAIGISFENFDDGKIIFDGWLKRLGPIDIHEELRISIIEGPLPDDPDGYTVFISANIQNTIRRKQLEDPGFNPKKFVRASQMNRMNPAPDSPYLRLFKEEFQQCQRYRLFPAHFHGGQLKNVDFTRAIEKREINLLRTTDLKPTELEYAVLDNANRS